MSESASRQHPTVSRGGRFGSRSRVSRKRVSLPPLSHVVAGGKLRMVDVGHKAPTYRTATAEAVVRLPPTAAALLQNGAHSPKGPVLVTAELAGVMAAKRTAELIPLCHTLPLDQVIVESRVDNGLVHLTSHVRSHGVTGVEMEALTAVTAAALTVYDMCKAAGKNIVIERVRLLKKTGGKSGAWRALQDSD